MSDPWCNLLGKKTSSVNDSAESREMTGNGKKPWETMKKDERSWQRLTEVDRNWMKLTEVEWSWQKWTENELKCYLLSTLVNFGLTSLGLGLKLDLDIAKPGAFGISDCVFYVLDQRWANSVLGPNDTIRVNHANPNTNIFSFDKSSK